MVKVLHMGHKVLAGKTNFVSEAEARLVHDFIERLELTEGEAAVAANQVGISQSWFKTREPLVEDILIYFNPRWVPAGKMQIVDLEACLSWPEHAIYRSRYQRIKFTFTAFKDDHFQKYTMYLEGYQARIVQHECDHLVGVGLWDGDRAARRGKHG